MSETSLPVLGVVVVAFRSGDVILDCLESLLGSKGGVRLRVVVVDNASPDNTVQVIRDWASGTAAYEAPDAVPFTIPVAAKPVALVETTPGSGELAPEGGVTLVHAGLNGGFAAGVNRGIEALEAAAPEAGDIWVLNPDGIAAPGAAAAFAQAAADTPGYGLIGGRLCYTGKEARVQLDGGTIDRKTGTTGNVNQGADSAATPYPRPEQMDFITGASMLTSRAFRQHAGAMPEHYFLYYEEVDWALSRGDLPLAVADGALVYHYAGTAIGSARMGELASPFSLYFKHRNRMWFVKKFFPAARLTAWAYGMAKIGQMALKRAWPEAWATFAAIHGMAPPQSVAGKLSPDAKRIAFAGPKGAPRVAET